jgi:sigma-54 dependent transcriptional regulator, acetoin dehydrogenase operon transcriptional activator AcoR
MALPARPLARPDAHLGAIRQSHERCTALGLSRLGRPDHAPLARSDLSVARERQRRLHSHAAPVMEMLFDQIAGTDSLVLLCDDTGTILHSVGDDDFMGRAQKVALQPGVNWAEQHKGTNAIGTALIDEQPTLVHADEHFMHANHFLTCSAVPILDPRGNILGVLDVTSDARSYHQHTMALVRMSARMIENHWLSDDHRDVMRLHFHGRLEFIGTLMEGILAVTAEGRIVGANRGALEQLGLSGAALRMQTLESLFGTSVGALVDRFRSPLATPLAARGAGGQVFHLQARFSFPRWAADPAATTLAPPPSPVAARVAPTAPGRLAAPGLAQLQTGDAQMQALVATLRRVLDTDLPVLLQGETGTGKGQLARAMHQDSRRVGLPFVTVLGAAADAVERFDAGAGTLFIDDIGSLSAEAQARLLQVLQVAPPGALVCATQTPLRERVEAGTFREDLFHRLSGLVVTLPPLRERSDLQVLARAVLADAGAPGIQLSAEVLALLRAHRWPGNLRQLRNVLRSAWAVAGSAGTLQREHLPADFLAAPAGAAPAEAALAPPQAESSARTLGDVEIDTIRAALAACDGNVSLAARRLGVSRNTIYRKLR